MSDIIYRMKFLEKKSFAEISREVGLNPLACFNIYSDFIEHKAYQALEEFYRLDSYKPECSECLP